jgi:hypothetical protein
MSEKLILNESKLRISINDVRMIFKFIHLFKFLALKFF